MSILDKNIIAEIYNRKISKDDLLFFITKINKNSFNIKINIDFTTNENIVEFNFYSKDYKMLHDFVHGE